MSDSARHSLFAILETVYGTTPATPEFSTVRHTGTTLGLSKTSIISAELRADRQIADYRHGTEQIGGDISTELSYGSFDALLEATLLGTWAAKFAPYVVTTISAAAADNSINDSANAFPAWVAGDKITIAGFTGTAGNNQNATVVSRTASKVVLTTTTPLVNDAAGESVTITSRTGMLKAGTTRRSFSIMRQFTDLDAGALPFHKIVGCEFNKLSIKLSVNAIVTAIFSLLGQDMGLSGTAPASSTYVAPTTTSPMDSFSGLLLEAGVAIAVLTEFTMNLENGLEARFVVGSKNTILPSIGRSNLSAQATAYFEDAALINKFLNETESSIQLNFPDLAGNAYRMTLPRIKYNGGQPDTQGQGAITLALPIQALYDSTTGTNIIIERNPV